ncbi:MAG TPA: hypothetical protein VJ972_12000, partial [Anaerolineales bacterium]|nr:hypothetical protein [Anaerolineales bacterium]
MGLTQIAASILTSILVGALTRGTKRTYSLLALSMLALYWFQPVVPLRFFDFWFPSLSIALVIITWFITSQPGVWKSRQNLIGLFITIGVITIVDLSRYILPEPIITATVPPQFIQYLIFFAATILITLSFTFISRRFAFALPLFTILLVTILLILKSPTLSLQTSIFFRTLANRPIETASALDLRWLGFSYISFR